MRLTTIGTGTVSPSASRVCAGHLVTAGSVNVLLDCGSGVVHGLARAGVDWTAITHVAITHFHADHLSDLAFLIFAWRHGAEQPRTGPVDIIGPVGLDGLVTRFADAFGSWVREPGFEVRVREIAPGAFLDLAEGVRLSAFKVPHTDESVAYDVAHDGRRLVYTGDTGYDEGLGRWASGCDLLLAECSLPDDREMAIHLTPRQCGELAAMARPRTLALTHFYPPVERVDIRAIVGERFDGPVVLADDGWSMTIEER
ncbi:MAG: MBL fold metallo-hydrolase [Gemmatimonadaceae bacterium]